MPIETTIDEIVKKHGAGAIRKLGDEPLEIIDVIPSGNISLDLALGVGGYPRGRIIELFGQESTGKTTISLHAIAEAQKIGPCAFIDMEQAIDLHYAKTIGVDIKELLVAQPSSGEEGLDIALSLIKSSSVPLIVIDSVAALTPQAELNGEISDAHVGRQARMMSQFLRMATSAANHSDTTIMFINQLRDKIGVTWGSPVVTPGGKALKYYSSIRLEVSKKEAIKTGTDISGTKTQVKVVKNKQASPFAIAAFDIDYGLGMSREGSLIDLGVELDVLDKRGAWYYWVDEQIGQGKENTKNWLKENPDRATELYDLIINRRAEK